MDEFEQVMEKAVQDGSILGAVVAARDKSGAMNYLQPFGKRTISPEVKPMEADTIFLLASMTKLMTTIAALQIVERGLIKLDDDVTPLVPVLAQLEVLTRFTNDGTPITKKREKLITFRHLLTHSFGGAYDFNPDILRWKEFHEIPVGQGATVDDIFVTPLLHEPGEGWTYGSGLDWAGKIVEKLSGLSLEDYMKRYIWGALELKDITFWPDAQPEISHRLASMGIRDAETGKAVQSRKPIRFHADAREACGGHAAFGSIADYTKILYSLLRDDERLLKKETIDMMFRGQLTPASKAALKEQFRHPEWAVGHYPDTGEYDWGLGGLLVDGDKHPYRKRNTMLWGGNANLAWFIDRAFGLCGVFGSQLLPPADVQIEGLMKSFEEHVYGRAGIKAHL